MKQIAKGQVFKDEYGEYCLIELTRGMCAKVDPCDYERANEEKWHSSTNGNVFYACRTTRKPKRQIYMHRLICGVKPGVFIDHRNGDGLDNRRRNLRVATNRENQRNMISRRGRSRFKGVSWKNRDGVWCARLKYNGRELAFGRFKPEIVAGVDIGEISAALAYDRAAKKYFGEFARPNILAG